MNTGETSVMSGRCVPPRKRIVEHHDVAGLEGTVLDCRLYRERHGAEMHRHVIALGNRAATAIVNGAGIVETLLDVRGEPGAAQRHAHLFGNRDEEVLEHFELDGIDGARAHETAASALAERRT